MRKVIASILILLLTCSANAEVWQARYGVAETFNFKLYNADGTLDVDEADGGAEVSLSCNEGTETTATNDFVDEGTFYSIALTATEMQCERIAVVIAATTTEVFFIQTHSNASAMTPQADANVTQYGGSAGTFSGGRPEVNTTHAAGTAWGSGAITAASIAADAITAAKIAADAIGASEIAADAIAAAEIANGAIDAATFAAGAIDATAIATDAIGAAELAADAIGASELATDAIGAAEIAANAITAAEVADGTIDEATFATTAGSFDALGIVDQGTAQAATGTTLQLRAAATFADDEIIGATCLITGGSAGVGQARTVTDYVSSTDTATVATWTTTPTGTITYECFGTSAGGGSVSIAAGGITASSFAAGAIDAAAIATDAIGAAELAADSITASEIAADAIGASELAASAIGASEIADGGITSAEFGTGAITATTIATDAIGAAEVAADVSTELLTGLAGLSVNATQISGDSAAADNLETAYDDTAGAVRWSSIIEQGTAQAATGTTLQLRAGASFADDEINGSFILITGGTGAGQVRQITDYVSSTDTATVATWTTTPSGTITYQVLPDITASAGGLTAADVWTYATRSLTLLDEDSTTIDLNATAVGSVAGAIGSVSAGGITASSFGAGAIDATAIAADAIGASELATDAIASAELAATAVTEIQSGLATAAAITSLDGKVGTPTDLGSGATLSANNVDIEAQTDDIGAAGAGLTAADDAVMARLGAPAGASIAADIAAIEDQTDDIGVAGAGLTAADDAVMTRLGTPAGASVSADIAAVEDQTDDIGAAGAGLTAADDAVLAAIEQTARADAVIYNCEVNTANFAGSTTTVACIVRDRNDNPITSATDKLEGRELLILTGAEAGEGRFINATTWDATNSELRLTLSRALPGTLADAVTALIR